jgi:LuxR family transcriptional regulator, maltose regulon positive regulatory protein
MATLAKLSRPRTHRVLNRERLFAALDEARHLPLVWVSGPPGAGKSTLVASYLGERKGRTAWYHLDSGDDDVGTFFYYLAQAAPAGKRNGNLPQFTPEDRSNLPAFSRHFFRHLFAHVSLLVLDNYHELSASSGVHDALDCAVGEVPEGCNIVAVSRGGPPRRIVRHQIGQRLASIDGTALAMSLEETRAIAALRGALDEQTVRRIHAHSGGWAAGVALTLQRARLVDKGGTDEGDHGVLEEFFEFFAQQVLDSTRPALQSFLQMTSLLPSMTAAMAEKLTALADSEAMLEELYRTGLFTDRRATQPPTYQYHDLFRAFLVRRHERHTAPDQRAEQLRKAGALLEEAGQPHHAIQLFLRASDWAAARRAILIAAPALVRQGRGGLVREWIGAIPAVIVERDPWLNFWIGMAQLRATPAQGRAYLEAAFRGFEAAGDFAGQTVACAALIRTYTYEFTDVRPLDPWIDVLQRLLAANPRLQSAAVELQVSTALLLALSFRRPLREPLEACMARVIELMAADVPDEDAATACGVLLMHLFNIGDLTLGEKIALRLKALYDKGQIAPVGHALGGIQIGRLHFMKREHAAAVRCFERVLALVDEHAIGLPVVKVYAHLGLSLCAIEQDDLEGSEKHRRDAEARWLPNRRIDEFATTRQKLWVACRREHWGPALALAERQIECAIACGVFWFAFEAYIEHALVCAELDRREAFEASLAKARPLVEGTGYGHFTYQADLAEAYYALLKGDVRTCHAKLRDGLALGRRDEGKLILRMHPATLPQLFAEALDARIDTEYVEQTIRTLHLQPPARDTKHWPWPLRIYTLGRFEVLRDGRPLEYSRKAPRKTLALLKAIIALGSSGVREQRLVDAFWPDEEGDAAERSLGAALHRLRTLIGDPDAIVQHGGVLSLDSSRVWVDAYAFEDLLARKAPVDAQDLLALYRGGFLAEDEGEPWAVTARERLRGRFIHAAGEAGQRLEAAGQPAAAIECYLRGLDADPVIEQFYQGLMRCYVTLDRPSEAMAAYQRLKRVLSVSLGLKPSAQTERLADRLRPSKTV